MSGWVVYLVGVALVVSLAALYFCRDAALRCEAALKRAEEAERRTLAATFRANQLRREATRDHRDGG